MTKEKIIIIAILVAIIITVIVLLIKNTKKTNLKKDIDELNVHFNNVKTAPIAFKLNKAQAVAKRNEDSASKVAEYYKKYEEAQKHINEIQESINHLEDCFALGSYKEANSLVPEIEEKLNSSDKEIEDIDNFLEIFQKEEVQKREYSAKLKEEFRNLKLSITENSNVYAYCLPGLEERIGKCESLFSSSEEWMYAGDYDKADSDLKDIELEILNIQEVLLKLPELIRDVKGVLPVLFDDVDKDYALARQKGIYLEHLEIDKTLSEIKENLNQDNKMLISARDDEVAGHINFAKESLQAIKENLQKENDAYDLCKDKIEEVKKSIEEAKQLHNYVEGSFNAEQERFGIQDLKPYLDEEHKKIKDVEKAIKKLASDLDECNLPSSEILEKANALYNENEIERKSLLSYKLKFDQTNSDEQRAIAQLQKLQVVINEIEIKVKEYRLPSIADSYYTDLQEGKKQIKKLKKQLKSIPIDVEKLNETLDEAIDYIYTFYNNVNNVVGMAIMVENAIVFGNKYRSSYPEVDRELSKAEFSYLNGEYTKALTIAINCMETLFPNVTDEKILENA